jgi:hypothetical protein
VTLRVQILKDKFNSYLGLPFKELLPESVIKQAISELKIINIVVKSPDVATQLQKLV